jgi:hypothetical protein
MNSKIEAIKEAVRFIQQNWIGKSDLWTGDVIDFVGAIVKGEVSHIDVRHLINAINNGEHTTVDGLGGLVKGNRIISVWVTKCTD